MNKILVDNEGYIQNINAKKLNKNIKTIKYVIIILLAQCIILSGMLLYKVESTKQSSMKNKDDMALLATNNNTVENKLENIVKKIDKIEEQESSLVSITSNYVPKVTETKTPEIKKTSNGESYTVIAKLNIPSLNINMDVLSSTSNALLKISLNKYWGADPNEVGNLCIVGHNYENGTHFSNLNKIKIGDSVKLTDNTGRTLTYTVYDTYVVDPYDTACTSQLTNGNTEVTLITCYNSGKERFVVKARA